MLRSPRTRFEHLFTCGCALPCDIGGVREGRQFAAKDRCLTVDVGARAGELPALVTALPARVWP
jgi:hypothetical protein